MEKAEQICSSIAEKRGGTAEVNWHVSTGAVHNAPELVDCFSRSVSQVEDIDVVNMSPRLYSEDFGWYLRKVPGMLFRFGTGSDEIGYDSMLHSNKFMIDEEGMKAAVLAFVLMVTGYPNNMGLPQKN